MAIADTFSEVGAEHMRCALVDEELELLGRLFDEHQGIGPGKRLFCNQTLAALLGSDAPISRLAQSKLGSGALPVRALVFDKRPESNWALGWHQDRTIAVRSRIDVPGFGTWTKKAGVDHVEPPFEIIEKMITLRVHLDSCDVDNAPLKIAASSHRMGRISVREINETVERLGSVECLAEPGDVWLYATPILHASDAAKRPVRRRVLQIDFSTAELPGGLQWCGV